jgi:hypothetical protein
MSKSLLRLAMREEGSFWNAYIAETSTMRGALLIGCIPMADVRNNIAIKTRFMGLMQDVMTESINEATGAEVSDYEVRPAPEIERGGKA